MSDNINSSSRVPLGNGVPITNVGQGDVVRPAMFNRLAEGIDKATPQGGVGTRTSKTPGGSTISVPIVSPKSFPFAAYSVPSGPKSLPLLTISVGNVFAGTAGMFNRWRDCNSHPVLHSANYTTTAGSYAEGYYAQGSEIMIDIADANFLSTAHMMAGSILTMLLKPGLYYIDFAGWSGRQLDVASLSGDALAKATEWNNYSKSIAGIIRPIIKFSPPNLMSTVLANPAVIPICTVDKYERIFQALRSDVFFIGYVRPGTVSPKKQVTEAKVTIKPFTVNRIVPKIDNEYLDATEAPELEMFGEGYVAVKCTHEPEKFFPRTAEIVFLMGGDLSSYPDTETESYFPIAKINPTGTNTYTIIQLSSSNLVVNRLKSGSNEAFWLWDEIG
jgi:hypothetical protein